MLVSSCAFALPVASISAGDWGSFSVPGKARQNESGSGSCRAGSQIIRKKTSSTTASLSPCANPIPDRGSGGNQRLVGTVCALRCVLLLQCGQLSTLARHRSLTFRGCRTQACEAQAGYPGESLNCWRVAPASRFRLTLAGSVHSQNC